MSAPRILVVDDEAPVRKLIAETLAGSGYEIIEASDGMEGVRVAKEGAPDLILLDVKMPVMDGYQVLRELRSRPETRTLPTIVLSALAKCSGFVEKGFDLGADEFLAKPIEMDELAVRVRTMLRLRDAERELQRVRSDFDYLLAQDFLNYLASVRGAITILLAGGEHRLGKEGEELIKMALRAMDDHAQILEEYAKLVRLGPGAVSVARRPQDLKPLVEEACRIVRPRLEESDLRIETRMDAGLPVVAVDGPKLTQALASVLTFAAQASKSGDVLTLNVTRRFARDGASSPAEEAVDVSVVFGAQVAREEVPLLLDRFEQARRWRVTEYKGLGLTLAKLIVEAHGGSIWIEPLPEREGSVVSLTLRN